MDAECYLVIDVLRATTTIAVLLARGAAEVRVVGSLAEARQFGGDVLRAGEERGFRPEGFDLGNSPTEAATAAVEGRRIVMATTNGTNALLAAAGRGAVFAASLVNLSAAAAAAAQYRRAAILCAGTHRGTRFALEDFAVAGLLTATLARSAPNLELGDGARLALACGRTPEASGMVRAAAHARYLASVGFGADIEAALQLDSWPVVPHVAASGEGWAALRC
ncbi:putative 2-phosphosulfolactate phosphatase [bacterium HR29]|nr:putative 2-phosphosulfolactate phosphatase [bacterium HR29]